MAAKNAINTNEVDLQDPLFNDLNLDGDLPDLAIVTEDDMKSRRIAEYARDLAFMEDMVTFTIAQSELPNAPDPVECAVNGEKRVYYRGKAYTDKRKFINVLINVTHNIDVVARRDSNGLEQSTIKRTPYTPINLSVHSDPAGSVGLRWMEYKLNGDRVVR